MWGIIFSWRAFPDTPADVRISAQQGYCQVPDVWNNKIIKPEGSRLLLWMYSKLLCWQREVNPIANHKCFIEYVHLLPLLSGCISLARSRAQLLPRVVFMWLQKVLVLAWFPLTCTCWIVLQKQGRVSSADKPGQMTISSYHPNLVLFPRCIIGQPLVTTFKRSEQNHGTSKGKASDSAR